MTSDIARMIRLARDQARLTTLDYATQLFDDFIELHGDRNFRDDGAVVGGIGFLAGQPVTVIGIQKGKNLQDNLKRNFGQPHPEGYRKALRLMKQAEKFGRPVLCFVDTSGAFCGIGFRALHGAADRVTARITRPWLVTVIGTVLFAALAAALPLVRFSGHDELDDIQTLFAQGEGGQLWLLAAAKIVAVSFSWMTAGLTPTSFRAL